MYAQFFGLQREPFSIAPDPRYLFMSERHREALAHLLYGLDAGGGFVLLSGEIGAGKTTVCRCFLEQVPKRCNVAYIFNPKLTVEELLKTVCDEFGVPTAGASTVKAYVDALNEYLLRTHAVGQHNVLIIDEAQSLSAELLEQLRLLTNLETNERKLLQIILIGQPELRTLLARPELEQLAQRVVARFHLEALSEAETAQYVRHRLAVAGRTHGMPFDREALRRIHKLSRGVPRRINLLCDRALLGAYAEGHSRVRADTIAKAAREVFGERAERHLPQRARATAWAGVAGGVVLAGAVVWWLSAGAARTPAVAPALAAASQPVAAASAPVAAHTAASAQAALPTAIDGVPLPGWRNETDAWRALAAQWKLALDDGDPCQAAARQQVHCYRTSNGDFALLRRLDRPGIVSLRDGEQAPVQALLVGLDAEHASLRGGSGAPQKLPLTRFAARWQGDFATFWRAPPGYAGAIGDAQPGSAADWLSARLDRVVGSADARQAPLSSRVQAFQTAQGLKSDGLAGPVTLMQLNRASGVDEPRLTTTVE
jgi:general secretion pathway protein A